MTLPGWMLLLKIATAQDEAAETTVAESGETILVMGDRVAVARAQLEQSLRRLGYTKVRRRDGETVLAPTGKYRWKSKIVLHDDGLLEFRDPRVVVLSPVAAGNVYPRDEAGISETTQTSPDRGDVSLQFPIMFPSARLQTQVKTRVLDTVRPDYDRWQGALADVGLEQSLTELPARLDALWREGKDPRNTTLHADVAARKAALIDLWATRTETDAGRAAREAIAQYLREVVQTSATPFTPEEVVVANERRGWGAELAL